MGNDAWEVKALLTRFKAIYGIELDNNQAERVQFCEEEKCSGTAGDFFSVWEELDYDEARFKEILRPEQFDSYLAGSVERVRRIEEELVKNDQQYLPQLAAAGERLAYLQQVLLPSLKKSLLPFSLAFRSEGEKIDYLKAMHQGYLVNKKKRILVEHFRHSRKLQPFLLKLSLLRHQQITLVPDYFSFKESFDSATEAVASFLLVKIRRVSGELMEAMRPAMDELAAFDMANAAKHMGEVRGWHTAMAENDKVEELMFVFLREE